MAKEIIISKKDEQSYLEIQNDKKCAAETLKIAMSFHHNALNRINESLRELWDHLLETYELDPNLKYELSFCSISRRAVLREVK